MKLAHIYIEHSVMSLDQTFTYVCGEIPVRRGVRVKVTFGFQSLIGFVDHVEEVDASYLETIPYKLKAVEEQIDEEPLMNEELFALAEWMAKHCVAPMISCFQAMLPAKLKPKSGIRHIKMDTFVRYVHSDGVKTKKQQEAIADFSLKQEMPRKNFFDTYKTIGKTLLSLGCVELIEKEAQATVTNPVCSQGDVVLTKDQKAAVAAVRSKEGHKVFLLHGVTGSGKTEVFLQLAQQVVKEGKQVLILVPEISLTPQMVTRVKERFGSAVAIYHSALNAQEKYEQYQLVKHHKVQVVVGTRSAVFMPFDHLGLIIMDEEHDQSYKQDSTPRYHCRDVAVQRGIYHNCAVLLASATPSLESYARAHKGVYQLVEMPHRINECFPEVTLVEMKQAIQNKENYMMSNRLMDAIYDRLQKKEQVMLLLNRRGYTPILRCLECGYVQMCPHCDIAMSYHKEDHMLKCHTCGHSMKLPNFCPDCGKSAWQHMGMGTQRLEELLHLRFPKAHVIRMDADTTTRKHSHEQLLKEFQEHGDILLGTQMIAKGLDFERVTLVGIVNGDALLHRSDYRCTEITYDLLEQACGRSGRGKYPGEVIIQAYDTKHYAIVCAKHHRYKAFFQKEMQYRHLAGYPPYQYLASMVFAAKDAAVSMQDAIAIRKLLSQYENIRILGPVELTKLKDEYRIRILLKGKQQEHLNEIVYKCYQSHIKEKQKSRMEIDLQPMMLD